MMINDKYLQKLKQFCPYMFCEDCNKQIFFFVAPIPLFLLVTKQIKMEGFIFNRWLDRHQECIQQNLKWLQEGKLKYRETVTEGFENTFKAFVEMLEGKNFGKAVVKV